MDFEIGWVWFYERLMVLNADKYHNISLNSMFPILVLNFVSVSRLELMYMPFIINIKSGHIFLHGFQLFVLLPELIEISFVYTNKTNLLNLKGNSDRKVIFAKGFLKLSNWLMLIKQKHLLLPRNLDRGFWQIARNVVNKGKSAILSLFNGPEVLHSASDWTKLLNSILDNLDIYLPAFPSRTNKKLHNISVTSKLVGRVITKALRRLALIVLLWWF